jgi:hypothetical protein
MIAFYVLYVVRLRSAATDRLGYLALAAVGVTLVINPEWTNQAASLLGIGRGADLMFYFFIVFCLFHFVTTAGTIRQLRRDVGDLTRELALLTAREPEMTSATADPVRGA